MKKKLAMMEEAVEERKRKALAEVDDLPTRPLPKRKLVHHILYSQIFSLIHLQGAAEKEKARLAALREMSPEAGHTASVEREVSPEVELATSAVREVSQEVELAASAVSCIDLKMQVLTLIILQSKVVKKKPAKRNKVIANKEADVPTVVQATAPLVSCTNL